MGMQHTFHTQPHAMVKVDQHPIHAQ